jgi:uncharacterized protein YfaS (alpha-2-macroglobulin family)
MDLIDPSGSTIYTTYNFVQNTTATFTYKVPEDVTGGEYQIKVSNFYTPPTVKTIRIRNYPRDQL